MYCKVLFLTLILCLFASCAQIGTITGGTKDLAAPKIISSTVVSGQTNVQTHQIEILFDERIELNKPNETAFISPKDVALILEKKNRTLVVSWKENLQKNTTYSISLNGTIKDFHEGNDSLYQIVFSTGNKIDSAQFFINVKGAFDNRAVDKSIVALYTALEDSVPRYFGLTNRRGEAHLNAIKPGTYFARSFADKNKNLFNDAYEPQSVIFEGLEITEKPMDTLFVFQSIPQKKSEAPTLNFIPPALLSISNWETWRLKDLTFLGNEVDFEGRHAIQSDSNLFYLNNSLDSIAWIFKDDTSTIQISSRDKNSLVSIQYEERENGISDSILLNCSDFVDSIQWDKIKIIANENKDTMALKGRFYKTHLVLDRPVNVNGRVKIWLQKGAIIGRSTNINDFFEETIFLREKKELGTLVLNREEESPIILQLLKDGKIKDERKGKALEFVFTNVLPGNYQLRVIDDLNENGRWDSLDLHEKKQAEKVKNSSLSIGIRANWEIKKNLNAFFTQ